MSTPTFLALPVTQVLSVDRWDGPGPWWPVFPVLWLLLVATVITALVVIGRRNRALAGPRAGEAKLAERFAAGEISEQEYRERRAVLREQSR
ncbi:MAG TPA: SHOCT domain-containing protein [Actinomycetes bacterium]